METYPAYEDEPAEAGYDLSDIIFAAIGIAAAFAILTIFPLSGLAAFVIGSMVSCSVTCALSFGKAAYDSGGSLLDVIINTVLGFGIGLVIGAISGVVSYLVFSAGFFVASLFGATTLGLTGTVVCGAISGGIMSAGTQLVFTGEIDLNQVLNDAKLSGDFAGIFYAANVIRNMSGYLIIYENGSFSFSYYNKVTGTSIYYDHFVFGQTGGNVSNVPALGGSIVNPNVPATGGSIAGSLMPALPGSTTTPILPPAVVPSLPAMIQGVLPNLPASNGAVSGINIIQVTPPGSSHPVTVYTDGNAQINAGKIEIYIRGKVVLDLDAAESRVNELEAISDNQPELFTKDMEKELQSLENQIHNYLRSQEMSITLINAGIEDTPENNQMIVENLLQAAKQVEDGNTEIISYISGPTGKVQAVSRWKILDDGTPYLATIILKPVK